MRSGKLAGYKFTALRAGEYSIYRGAAEGQDPVLLLVPREERNSHRRLEHEFGLREDLDPHWAARPLAIARHKGRMALVLGDPGGEPLDQLLAQSLDTATFLCIAIADTLQQVHERGLIHKDIKPANILLDKARGSAWLTGFSIASRLPREQQLPEPPEVIAGTLAYMAPEQTGRMNRSIDSRSDLYSLGVTFYELLTRALPFAATDPIELIHCHIARQPVPPAILAAVPAQLSAIVMKLLAKTAEERYQTAAGLKADLHRCRTAWEQTCRIDPFPVGLQDASNRLMIPEKLYGRTSESPHCLRRSTG
ncbi:serine/threonine protein kinase [Nitrobacteraceae bacterium AZCC 2146]